MQTHDKTDLARLREPRVQRQIRLANLEYRLRALCGRWSDAAASRRSRASVLTHDRKRWAAAIKILEERVAREAEIQCPPPVGSHRFATSRE